MTSQVDDPGVGGGADFGDLSVAATLAEAEQTISERHAVEVRQLLLDLHYADMHSADPRDGRPAPSLADAKRLGWTRAEWDAAQNKLIALGGDGAPKVQDLPLFELAAARHLSIGSLRAEMADALDLAHRLPLTWALCQDGATAVWVVRKIAKESRHLTLDQVKQVDLAVAGAVSESPGRLLGIAEAEIIRADPEHANQKDEERRRRRCLVVGRLGEDGLRTIFGRVAAGDAVWLDAMLERVADALSQRPDLSAGIETRDELRAEALGWLCHLEDVIALLNGTYPISEQAEPPARDTERETAPETAPESDEEPDDGGAPICEPDVEPPHTWTKPTSDDQPTWEPDEEPQPDEEPERPAPPLGTGLAGRPVRSRAVVYVHLSEAAIGALVCGTSTGFVARVEGLGPMTGEQVRRLLRHAHVDVKPVIDLNHGRSVNGYEHPPDVVERGFLRTIGEVFPHATSQSRRVDGDHPVPYDPNGPPGQTGDHNFAPLTRGAHRAKTFLPYQLYQLGLATYLWRTPHGLWRLVDGTGTHIIDEETARAMRGD